MSEAKDGFYGDIVMSCDSWLKMVGFRDADAKYSGKERLVHEINLTLKYYWVRYGTEYALRSARLTEDMLKDFQKHNVDNYSIEQLVKIQDDINRVFVRGEWGPEDE